MLGAWIVSCRFLAFLANMSVWEVLIKGAVVVWDGSCTFPILKLPEIISVTNGQEH